ncbi:MAG: AbgT family transporter [Eisenbergiella sp.]
MNENAGIKSEKDREPMYIRILAKIEKAGNRLPDPVVLFAFLCVLLLIISYFTAGAMWSIPVRGDDYRG